MVVHVEPATQTGFVVSFPRDTWVDDPGSRREPLNAAFELGGPSLDPDVRRRTSTCRSQHYLEVDFQGFQKIVDTIGAREHLLPDAGARQLLRAVPATPAAASSTATQALAYVRARTTIRVTVRPRPTQATGARIPLQRPRPHPAPAVLPAQPRPDGARSRRRRQPGHRGRAARQHLQLAVEGPEPRAGTTSRR